MNMTVAGEEVPFLVDTGATCSTMKQPLGPISNQTMSVVGFSGVSQTLSFTTPLPTQLAGQQHLHRFLISPEVPVNLLGRDLLIKLGATILCGPEGLVVSFPNGTDIPCGLTCERSGQYLVRSPDTLHADIYWGLLQPSHKPTTGLLSAYNSWRPWISRVHPYDPPPDPPHLTLFYDRDGDECYLEAFQEQVQDHPVWVSQYPHKPAAAAGIAETIQGLLNSGVLEESTSAWNTPILPVEKKGTGKFRMAHDLRAINKILTTNTVPVPNPYVALNNLSPTHKYFTCVDLANAFFCLPLATELRDVFSFTYQNQQLRYTRLPQGFALSPGIFNQVLKSCLSDLELPPGTVLIQYMDDLLLASDTASDCLTATTDLLRHLNTHGFKVSKAKLQIARQQVSFLGRLISQKGASMSPAHRTNILHHTQPHTVKDMLSFLGLVGYSRHYIPNFTGLTQQLRALVREIGMHNLTASLNWTLEAEQAFIRLKQALAKSCDLAIPDYTLPFHLDVSETDSVVNGVLFQKKGGDRTTLTYLSIMLDPMEKRHPSCTRHVAGVAKLITKCAHIVMGHPLHVLTSHSIVAYVNSQTFTTTSLRQQRLSKVLEAPNLIFTHEGINMADRIGHGPTHECATRVTLEDKARPDLKTSPIAGADDVYTDGCCFRHPQEGLKAGYAVIKRQRDDYLTVTAERLKGAPSAQRAEVVALIEALKSAAGQKVNIYTDSAYAVHAAQVDLGQWIRAGFRTASQTPIKHEEEMRELVDALQLPEEVAILKCRGHDSGNSPQARGNQAADTAAKKAAGYQVTMCMVRDDCEDRQNMLTLSKIGEEQDKASPQEKSVWVQRGAKKADGIWRSADGRLVMPPGPRESLLQEAHGVGHHGAAQMRKTLEEWWHPYLQDMIAHVGKTCPECTNYNIKPPYKPGPDKVIKRKWSEPRWTGPFRVTERTSHAVRLEGKGDTWYHLSQCAPGLEPQRTLQETAADVVKNASKEWQKQITLNRVTAASGTPLSIITQKFLDEEDHEVTVAASSSPVILLQVATGYSERNTWLDWLGQTAGNCPLLQHLYPACNTTIPPVFTPAIGNYTCFNNTGSTPVGSMIATWCASYAHFSDFSNSSADDNSMLGLRARALMVKLINRAVGSEADPHLQMPLLDTEGQIDLELSL
ncbi:uncharacterized protein [Embiotoca jacksoni]|uniref:uncharacterized protein n=1 Tax=Embiotoca jacksoni TaxID=100190 RepID=UPI00370448C9